MAAPSAARVQGLTEPSPTPNGDNWPPWPGVEHEFRCALRPANALAERRGQRTIDDLARALDPPLRVEVNQAARRFVIWPLRRVRTVGVRHRTAPVVIWRRWMEARPRMRPGVMG